MMTNWRDIFTMSRIRLLAVSALLFSFSVVPLMADDAPASEAAVAAVAAAPAAAPDAAAAGNVELVDAIGTLMQNTNADGWPLAIAALLSLALAFLRGKVTVRGRRLAIPVVTDAIAKIPSAAMPWVILVVSTLVGGFVSLNSGSGASSFIAGAIQGVVAGFSSMGLYSTQKSGKAFLAERRRES